MTDSDIRKSSFMKGLQSSHAWLDYILFPATFMGLYYGLLSRFLNIPSDQQVLFYLLGIAFLFQIILFAAIYNIDKDKKKFYSNIDKQINGLKGAITDVSKRSDQTKNDAPSPYLKLAGDTFTIGDLSKIDGIPRSGILTRAYEIYFDGTGNVLIEFTSTGRPVETWVVDKWHFDRNQYYSQYIHYLSESNSSSIPLIVGGKDPYYLIFTLKAKTNGARVEFSIKTKENVKCLNLCSVEVKA